MGNSKASTLFTITASGSSKTGLFAAENLGPYDIDCWDPECQYCTGPEID
jgi:hypothetical protein